ncbi:MAG: helix-turn-helix domain-containing protein [Pseudomonadota bacterium]|nr:helix-turn-helix domain-containing protein [Pseudomonadota bacterium]
MSTRIRTRSPIARRLKEARLRAGLSQKALGILAGFDQFVASARMNQYERGVHEPSFATLALVARQLNVPTCYFFADDDALAELVWGYSVSTASQKKQLLQLTRKAISAQVADSAD